MDENEKKMFWLLAHDVLHQDLHKSSQLNSAENHSAHKLMIEIGPRPTMSTAFSTNAVSACRSAGIEGIQRLEQSQRYLILLSSDASQAQCAQFQTFLSSDDCRLALLDCLGDKMTECEYLAGRPPNSEMLHKEDKLDGKASFQVIDIIDAEHGEANLRDADEKLGLALDQSDFDFYLQFFRERLQRNPTDVELFDLAQSNSEHSRHWFFKGNMVVDGVQRLESLFKTIQKTQLSSNNNNVICFSDNSSAIKGFPIKILASSQPQRHSLLTTKRQLTHIVYTAETHNFPTGVCPFPGAATGVGGRIRDNHATGRGAHEIAGLAGYSVGNLNLPNCKQPWEGEQWKYPSSLASPVKILLEASDGASDYGNKFGEPIISGFTRTFGMQLQRGDSSPEGERIEYIKPIMFSGGIGSIDDSLITKVQPQKGQLVAKIGGPVYRIGVGGGAASSLAVQGKRENAIDYGAVQRGDPEMEQKLHRLIRSCAELGADANPILSIHDQGAGGNGNVLKEIVESTQPESQKGGAIIHADAFELGDSSITLRELWGAEYQESDAILLDPTKRDLMQKIADRERCSLSVVGQVTGDGRVVLTGFGGDSQAQYPVDLDLEQIAEREPKTFNLTSGNPAPPHPFYPTKPLTLESALERVLRLPSVACKRFLTSKVDRSVTGLIVQQQCVGPLHTPLADVGVVALSYWEKLGAAVALGEQPVKGLVNPGVGARMSVGEALTNLVFAPITCIEDVKCSGNWMWAAKLPEEGTRLVAACDAMCALMAELGVAVDGGKDSLSMATQVEDFGVVKAPGTLVITAYAPCVDITKVITPDFKPAGSKTTILHLPMASQTLQKQPRLGGSALAQCHAQLGGQSVPDLDDAAYFKHCFNMVQNWIKQDMLLSGHDVSDGGLLTAVLECAFAGNCSVQCFFNIPECDQPEKLLEHLFAEELGLILEVQSDRLQQILLEADKNGIRICEIGQTLAVFGPDAKKSLNGLREVWEETSDNFQTMQLASKCVEQQANWRQTQNPIQYSANFDYQGAMNVLKNVFTEAPKIAILREEGSNGDREMAAAFMMAGFQAYDLTMQDILEASSHSKDLLKQFQGIAFVGGFSYGDVLGSAKGWAASIKFNQNVTQMFAEFRSNPKTFSLGVCNGCQLMTLLGFVGAEPSKDGWSEPNVFLDDNESGRFYSGFNTVRIEKSNSILLTGMQDAVLGVWCSHGEGKFVYKKPHVFDELLRNGCVSLRYSNNHGQPTMQYPDNPNGSQESVAGLCSLDGRHLALMPHPDRSFLSWQWPNYPWTNEEKSLNSPWMKLFLNAFEWCISQ